MCTFKASPSLKNKEGKLNMKRLYIKIRYPCTFLSLVNTQSVNSGEAFACIIQFISVSLLRTNKKAPTTLFYKNKEFFQRSLTWVEQRGSVGKEDVLRKNASWRIPLFVSISFPFFTSACSCIFQCRWLLRCNITHVMEARALTLNPNPKTLTLTTESL